MVINILEYLEDSAKNHPHKIAFSDRDIQISYSELMDQAKAIGYQIAHSLNGQIRQPIIVIARRNISTIISFMGVLYSGNFYVPVDHKMPDIRINHIFNTVQPAAVLLTDTESTFHENIKYEGPQIALDQAKHQPVDQVVLNKIRCDCIDTDPLFAVFTSGSTGIPKCVLISHRSVIDLVEQFSNLFDLSGEIILGNQAPLDYDGSVKEICLTLKNGSRMHIIPKLFFSFPALLFKHMNEMRINTINWSTSALRIIASHKALEKVKPLFVDRFFFSGEVMPNKVLNSFRKHFPDALFVNLFGPTEITFNCSYYVVNRPFKNEDPLPIGIPFPNTKILVLDENNSPIEQGEIGEICVGGTSLALGYYNNPDATSRVFIQNPLNQKYSERIYRTGDLGKFNEHGELMFVSRKDDQIKHMGYRIELGEIEAAANALENIETACCIYDPHKDNIVLFYQAPEPFDKVILSGLKEQLPKYMLPAKFIHFKRLPINQNGKIDKMKLRNTLNEEA